MTYLPQVKESPVPSDSLLTLDLKSGSKVNIGTYVITLDKFFEGHLKVTRSFDIGNGEGGRAEWKEGGRGRRRREKGRRGWRG